MRTSAMRCLSSITCTWLFSPACTPAPAVMLEHAVDVVGDLDLPALLAHQLLHPLPRRVVEVVRMHRGLGAVGLGAEGLHLVAVVPLEVA